MKIVIVIPTYNESQNIGRMIDVLEEEFKGLVRHDFSILVVEGNSPDGTADIVRGKAAVYSNVVLLMEEKKAGLGAAYMYGFKYAVDTLKPDYVIEMDADFQHDPADLKKIITKIDEGYDYVIGSRFTRGGSIPKEWTLDRKILSVGGNLVSKIVLGILSVNDFTSGFKASRVKGFVEKLVHEQLLTKGFAYKIELLYKMHLLGAKIAEVPIQFGVRDRGNSKMEKNNPSDSLRVVLMLRFNHSKAFFKFLFVGLAGLVTDTTLFTLLRLLLENSKTAALVSGLVAMLVTYTLNNCWSFGDRSIKGFRKNAVIFIVYFVSSNIPVLVRSYLVGLSVKTFGDTFIPSYGAFFAGIMFGLIWNYTVYSRFLWKKIK